MKRILKPTKMKNLPLPSPKACDMTWSPTVSAVYGGKKIAKVSIIEFGMNEER